MSMRFWLASAGMMGGAAVAGLSLGAYAVRAPASEWEATPPALAASVGEGADSVAADPPPRSIQCTGCGPTLAERQYAADMAGMGLDGMEDPVLRDYMAQADEETSPVPASMPAPPPPQRLPPMAERLASAGPTQPVVARPTVFAAPSAVVQPISVTAAP